jgi:hypothetical protein
MLNIFTIYDTRFTSVGGLGIVAGVVAMLVRPVRWRICLALVRANSGKMPEFTGWKPVPPSLLHLTWCLQMQQSGDVNPCSYQLLSTINIENKKSLTRIGANYFSAFGTRGVHPPQYCYGGRAFRYARWSAFEYFGATSGRAPQRASASQKHTKSK